MCAISVSVPFHSITTEMVTQQSERKGRGQNGLPSQKVAVTNLPFGTKLILCILFFYLFIIIFYYYYAFIYFIFFALLFHRSVFLFLITYSFLFLFFFKFLSRSPILVNVLVLDLVYACLEGAVSKSRAVGSTS